MLALLEDCQDVVSVRDCFEANRTAYIVMEYVQGENLAAYARRMNGTIPPKELFPLMRGPIEALAQVHGAGLLHRDICPSNLMLEPNGRVKLIDFGAATDLCQEQYTQDITVIIHKGYAAPEQYAHNGRLGTWTDVHGVCATIYMLLTGREIDGTENFSIKKITQQLPPGIRVPKKILRALCQGLHPNDKIRTRSMPELLNGLYNVPLPEELMRKQRLIRLTLASTAVAGLMLMLILINAFVGFPNGSGLYFRLHPGGFS